MLLMLPVHAACLSAHCCRWVAVLPVQQRQQERACTQPPSRLPLTAPTPPARVPQAKVVDACASCDYGDIDLSKRALKKSTGYEWDRKAVT